MYVFLIILIMVAGALSMPLWMPRAWYRAIYYPGGRPNALARRNNALMAWIHGRGIAPSLMVTLETRGRRTGKILRVPLVVAEFEGNRYLVSMLGEHADWVRNLRTSGGEALMLHGSVETIRTEEVSVAERAPILRAYLKRAPGARPHFDIDMNAPLEDFARVAARYPVFRILPQTASAGTLDT